MTLRHERAERHTIQIRKGDNVRVIAGKDTGKSGRVLSINAKKNTVGVEHVAIIKRHTRPNPSKNIKGGIEETEAEITDSHGRVVGGSSGRRPRTGRTIVQVRPIGCAVTLRGDDMSEFLDRLCNVVLPRVRDFRGLPQNSFDGRGNYTLGLKDQLVFPEIDYTRVDKIKGMNITMTTSAKNDEQGRELLKGLGFPFREKGVAQ